MARQAQPVVESQLTVSVSLTLRLWEIRELQPQVELERATQSFHYWKLATHWHWHHESDWTTCVEATVSVSAWQKPTLFQLPPVFCVSLWVAVTQAAAARLL